MVPVEFLVSEMKGPEELNFFAAYLALASLYAAYETDQKMLNGVQISDDNKYKVGLHFAFLSFKQAVSVT